MDNLLVEDIPASNPKVRVMATVKARVIVRVSVMVEEGRLWLKKVRVSVIVDEGRLWSKKVFAQSGPLCISTQQIHTNNIINGLWIT